MPSFRNQLFENLNRARKKFENQRKYCYLNEIYHYQIFRTVTVVELQGLCKESIFFDECQTLVETLTSCEIIQCNSLDLRQSAVTVLNGSFDYLKTIVRAEVTESMS